jgi:hypothetical protein
MPARDNIGPYDRFPMEGGRAAPFYLIVFDKGGRCQSPLSLAHLLEHVDAHEYSDVHVFSHGWNNVFKEGVKLYRDFFGHYFELRKERNLNDAGYRPVVVGIVWPSTLLVLPWESTPHIAGGAPGPERDDLHGADEQALSEVAAALGPQESERLYYFAERGPTLTPAEARELATLLLPMYQGSPALEQSREVGEAAPAVTVDEVLRIWSRAAPARRRRSGQAGFAADTGAAGPAQPMTAALDWSHLDPRWPVRIASVLQMKDRAGTVGAKGVGPVLVQKLLAKDQPRVHLIGHSYGAKVILSSLCSQAPAHPAASLLLLEPAVSYLCFGENLDGKGRQGGYRDALARVRQPVLSTFSSADTPLTKFFHLAVIRDSDWGEQKIAGEPPNKFAALGGFGPGGLRPGESKTLDVLSPDAPTPANRYPQGEAGIRIYGLNGSQGQITGHGDVANKFTAWAHLNLVSGGALP